MDLKLENSNWNNFSSTTFFSGKGNGTRLLKSNFNTFSNCYFGSSFDFGMVLDNGTGNRVISNTFADSNYYSLFINHEFGDFVQHNQFKGIGHFSGTQVFDSGTNNLFLNNFWNGIADNPVIIDGPSHSLDNDPLNLNAFNSITTVTATLTVANTTTQPPASPGFTIVLFLSSIPIIAIIALIKRKNLSKKS